MIIDPYRFAIARWWNPDDKSSYVVLSESNTVAVNTFDPSGQPTNTHYRGVRAVVGHSSGRYYFEVATTSNFGSGDFTNLYAGIANASVNIDGPQPIFDSLGGKYFCVNGGSSWGTEAGLGGTHAGGGFASYGSGVNVLGLDCDLDAKTVTIYDAGGNRGTKSYSASAGVLYPWTQNKKLSYDAGMKLRLTSAEFTLGMPSGASEWGSS